MTKSNPNFVSDINPVSIADAKFEQKIGAWQIPPNLAEGAKLIIALLIKQGTIRWLEDMIHDASVTSQVE